VSWGYGGYRRLCGTTLEDLLATGNTAQEQSCRRSSPIAMVDDAVAAELLQEVVREAELDATRLVEARLRLGRELEV
jgi:hypothetical protein